MYIAVNLRGLEYRLSRTCHHEAHEGREVRKIFHFISDFVIFVSSLKMDASDIAKQGGQQSVIPAEAGIQANSVGRQ